MAKRIFTILLIVALMISASACSSVFSAEHSFSEPYTNESISLEYQTGVEVNNYHDLMTTILDMISKSETKKHIIFSNYNGSVNDDMAEVCVEIKSQAPMGAYAVEDIDYELSRIVSYYKADLKIVYKRTAAEIRSVVGINDEEELREYIRQSLNEDRTEMAIRIYSTTITENTIREMIYDTYMENPLLVVAEPIVDVTAYPKDGISKVYDVRLEFGEFSSKRQAMRILLEDAVDNASLSIAEDSYGYLAYDAAKYLSNYWDVSASRQLAYTAYGALLDYKANSKGVSMAYKAVCDKLGIECIIVEGTLGAMATQTHFWNIINLEGNYYHVDVSRMGTDGAASTFLLKDTDIWGDYLWDAAEYPECKGPLNYYRYLGSSAFY